MNPAGSILELRQVSVAMGAPYETGLSGLDVKLSAGDLLLVQVDAAHARTPFADVAGGLLHPDEGQALFLGHDWSRVPPYRAAEMRGRIGRVYDTGGWVSNLDVDENILLAQRYHTGRTEASLWEEARALARDLGMAELPAGRPAFVARRDLRRGQWVRAFMGEPCLVILERPLREVPGEWRPPLLQKVREVRERGAAVVWVTSDTWEAGRGDLKPTLKTEIMPTMIVNRPETV